MISRVCSFLHCSNIKAFNQHIGVSNVHYRAELSTHPPHPVLCILLIIIFVVIVIIIIVDIIIIVLTCG